MGANPKNFDSDFDGLSEDVAAEHDHRDQLLVEVSEKPFMNILWIGTIILTLGTFNFSHFRHFYQLCD